MKSSKLEQARDIGRFSRAAAGVEKIHWDEWVDEATGLDCRGLQGHGKEWLGYVRIPKGHPWYGVNYMDLPIHSMSYSGYLDGEDWWIGFYTYSMKLVHKETAELAQHVKNAWITRSRASKEHKAEKAARKARHK